MAGLARRETRMKRNFIKRCMKSLKPSFHLFAKTRNMPKALFLSG